MCPLDDSHLTIEFDDHYVITPSIKFIEVDRDFHKNAIGEEGKSVDLGFEYSSKDNHHFLSVGEIKKFNV